MNRFIVFAVGGCVLMIGTPFFIAQQMELGSNAKSPQTVEVPLGSTVLVGGGRARLWYGGGASGGDFEIQCTKETRFYQPFKEKGCQACGVRVTFLHSKPGRRPDKPRGVYRVEW